MHDVGEQDKRRISAVGVDFLEISTEDRAALHEEVRDRAIDDVLKKYLDELIRQTNGNLKEARRIAGWPRNQAWTR